MIINKIYNLTPASRMSNLVWNVGKIRMERVKPKKKKKSRIFHSGGCQPHGLKQIFITILNCSQVKSIKWWFVDWNCQKPLIPHALGNLYSICLAPQQVKQRCKKEKWEWVGSQPWLLLNRSQPRLEEVGIPRGGTQVAAFFESPDNNMQARLF